MKKSQIARIFNFVSDILLNKVEDKNLRKWVVSTHIATYKVVKGVEDDINELRKKYFEGKEEAVRECSEKFGKDASYKPSDELAALIAEFGESVNALYAEESPAKVEPLSMEQVDELFHSQGKDYLMGDVLAITEMLK